MIGSTETEIYTRMLSNVSRKPGAQFLWVKIASLDNVFAEIFYLKASLEVLKVNHSRTKIRKGEKERVKKSDNNRKVERRRPLLISAHARAKAVKLDAVEKKGMRLCSKMYF